MKDLGDYYKGCFMVKLLNQQLYSSQITFTYFKNTFWTINECHGVCTMGFMIL